MLDGEDSEEETSREEQADTNWSELSIVERVGLNSVEMSEKDLETAFSQITLAFHCDQYTLKQRLQAEEHARNLAEENIQLELTRGRETLETLKDLCLDSQRSSILQKLELCLDILGGTVERISNTAEVLGAVHQEARVSRTVELMVAHVESLRRRHDRNAAELEETKRMLQQQQQQQQQQQISSRNISPSTFSDPEESEKRKGSNHSTLRRRISASIISSQTQEKKRRDSKKQASSSSSSSKKPSPQCRSPSPSMDSSCSFVSKEDSNSTDDRQLDPVEPPKDPHPDPSPMPNTENHASQQVTPVKTQSKNPPLRQRHKGKAASANKGREKKVANIHRHNSAGMYGSSCKQHPPTLRSHRCRLARVCANLFMLSCVVTLVYYVWKLYEGELEP
ncbi:inositol 1,4,5-triphosphate receptor associated 2 [Kryptolebias marmoratus]|uniref:Lymphoid-restricted membrane protein-like n=1 Tax=Kryptolebias marmoratus TaxID=37003 RepID=A0A3Q3F7L8_KRYMA|nr:inositol 1,4,5-triphosphate receptor associated 2 [Kryptolebias marmoratus]